MSDSRDWHAFCDKAVAREKRAVVIGWVADNRVLREYVVRHLTFDEATTTKKAIVELLRDYKNVPPEVRSKLRELVSTLVSSSSDAKLPQRSPSRSPPKSRGSPHKHVSPHKSKGHESKLLVLAAPISTGRLPTTKPRMTRTSASHTPALETKTRAHVPSGDTATSLALPALEWMTYAEHAGLLLTETELARWPVGSAGATQLYPVERTRFEVLERYNRRLKPHTTYTPEQLWRLAELETWTRTSAKPATVTYPYVMLPGCRVGPQTFRSYAAQQYTWYVDTGYECERDSELATEPGVAFVAYRASGDAYTRYLTHDALLRMPPVRFESASDYAE
jgi:hypothetical protein